MKTVNDATSYINNVLSTLDDQTAKTKAVIQDIESNSTTISGTAYIPTGYDKVSSSDLIIQLMSSYGDLIDTPTINEFPSAVIIPGINDCVPTAESSNHPITKFSKDEIKNVVKQVSDDCSPPTPKPNILNTTSLLDAVKAKCDITAPVIQQPGTFIPITPNQTLFGGLYSTSPTLNNILNSGLTGVTGNNGIGLGNGSNNGNTGGTGNNGLGNGSRKGNSSIDLNNLSAADINASLPPTLNLLSLGDARLLSKNDSKTVPVTLLKNVGDKVTCSEPIMKVGNQTLLSPVSSGTISKIFVNNTASSGQQLVLIQDDSVTDLISVALNSASTLASQTNSLTSIKEKLGKIEPYLWIKKIIAGIYEGQLQGYTEYFNSFLSVNDQIDTLSIEFDKNTQSIKKLLGGTLKFTLAPATPTSSKSSTTSTVVPPTPADILAADQILADQQSLATQINALYAKLEVLQKANPTYFAIKSGSESLATATKITTGESTEYQIIPLSAGQKSTPMLKQVDVLGNLGPIIAAFTNDLIINNQYTPDVWNTISKSSNIDVDINQPNILSYSQISNGTGFQFVFYLNGSSTPITWSGSHYQTRKDLFTSASDPSADPADLSTKEQQLPSKIESLANQTYAQVLNVAKQLGYFQLYFSSAFLQKSNDKTAVLTKLRDDSLNDFNKDYATYQDLLNQLSVAESHVGNFQAGFQSLLSSGCSIPDMGTPSAGIVDGQQVSLIQWPVSSNNSSINGNVGNSASTTNSGNSNNSNGGNIGNNSNTNNSGANIGNNTNSGNIGNNSNSNSNNSNNNNNTVVGNSDTKGSASNTSKTYTDTYDPTHVNPIPTDPTVTSLEYWKKYCSVATTVNLIPTYWPIGILIPTPGGLIKIPMPIIWLPITVVSTPFCVIVIGIALCGICPAPFVYIVNPNWPFPIGMVSTNSSWHVSGLRGPQQISGDTGSKILPAAPYIQVPLVYKDKGSIKSQTLTLDAAPYITKTIPFIQDDIPPYKNLSLSNIPFLLYLTKWCAAGKKTMGFFEN